MIVVDVETGGLDPEVNPLLSIGAVDYETLSTFYIKLIPFGHMKIEDQALEINGIDPKTWGGEPLVKAMTRFQAWLWGRKFPLAGHNPSFDRNFCNANFERAGIDFQIPYRTVDLHTLAYAKYGMGNGIVEDKLTSDRIYELLGMATEPKPHNALVGATMEAEAFRRLL